MRSKVEISREVLGHGLNSTDKEWRDLLSARCLLFSKSCGKPLVLTNSHFLHNSEVKIQKKGRKNSMFICINSVLTDATGLKTVLMKKISFVFKSKDRKKGISLSY